MNASIKITCEEQDMNDIKPGKMFECYISNVTDPSDFHIQLKSTEPLIRQIMYEMAQFYDNPENLEKYKIRAIEPGEYLLILRSFHEKSI